MESEWESPESMDRDGTNFLREPGWYHFSAVEIDEAPEKLDIGTFKVSAEVLAGTVDGQEGKVCNLTFFAPKLTQKNNGEFAKKKRALFADAVGILPKAAPGEKIKVDLQKAQYRQFVAQVSFDEKDADKKYLELHFAEIYHVDDPAVAKVPKSASALGLLPKDLRRSPDSFKKPDKKPSGNGTTHAGGSKPAAGATAPASTVEVSDL